MDVPGTDIHFMPSRALTLFGSEDKVQHAMLSGSLAFMFACLSEDPIRSIILGTAIPGALAYGKEFVDYKQGRGFNMGDLCADSIGIATGVVLGLIAVRLMKRAGRVKSS